MVKDGSGNALEVGNIVHIKLGNDWSAARITKITEGGTLIQQAGQKGMTPDRLSVEIDVAFVEPPGHNHGAIMRLVNPEKESVIPKGQLA
jgi:hypothetical protein